MEVYLPQYLAKIFLAYLLTATMDRGIRGTQRISTTATRHSIHTVTKNSTKGASMA